MEPNVKNQHHISNHDIPHVGEGRQRRLEAAGLDTLEALATIGVDELAEIPYMPRVVAEEVVEAAQTILREEETQPDPREMPRQTVERMAQRYTHRQPSVSPSVSARAERGWRRRLLGGIRRMIGRR